MPKQRAWAAGLKPQPRLAGVRQRTYLVASIAISLLVTTNPSVAYAQSSFEHDIGPLLYSDDFHDSGTGWRTAPFDAGGGSGYRLGGYVLNPPLGYDPFVDAPFHERQLDLIEATSFRLPSGEVGVLEGGGLQCNRPGPSEPYYLFFVWPTGRWRIQRFNKERQSFSDFIASGTVLGAGVEPGAEISMVAECHAEDIGSKGTVHLALWINGRLVADLDDRTAVQGDGGWQGGVSASAGSAPEQPIIFHAFAVGTKRPASPADPDASAFASWSGRWVAFAVLACLVLVALVSIGSLARRRRGARAGSDSSLLDPPSNGPI
jgi:hypothetical protein